MDKASYWQCWDGQAPADRLPCPRPRFPQVLGCSSSGRSRPALVLVGSETQGVELPEVELVECKVVRWDEGSDGCSMVDGCFGAMVEVCLDGRMLPGLDVGVVEVGSGRKAGRWLGSKPPDQSRTCWRGWRRLGRLKNGLEEHAKARIEARGQQGNLLRSSQNSKLS